MTGVQTCALPISSRFGVRSPVCHAAANCDETRASRFVGVRAWNACLLRQLAGLDVLAPWRLDVKYLWFTRACLHTDPVAPQPCDVGQAAVLGPLLSMVDVSSYMCRISGRAYHACRHRLRPVNMKKVIDTPRYQEASSAPEALMQPSPLGHSPGQPRWLPRCGWRWPW